ncbi:MAG: hypothetical protein KGH98_02240 [Candidatus Micrarchaeota archaeon]|nr:hypothetical protein [Candidatus Micrarchaeota archaeon]
MKSNTKSMLALLMGVIILVADIYWTYTSYYDKLWLALGAIILVADLIWLYLDWSLMKRK